MSDREKSRLTANRDELTERIARLLPRDGTVEPMEGLVFARLSKAGDRVHGMSRPSFCVIAQGRKELYVGAGHYPYDPHHYLLGTVALPVTGRVVEASAERPYLSVRLDLDPTIVASTMVEAGLAAPPNHSDAKAVVVSPLEPDLLDATLRLVRLVDDPAQASVLAPLVKREIIYRLLTGEQGHRLLHLPMLGSHSHRIARAMDELRKNFDRPLKIEDVARKLGMSGSGFYHHFKAITDLTPLQFQKQLRLQEARRLMLGENLDAASAAFTVGYSDASHFSREYKRQFGQSPMRDVEQLRRVATADASHEHALDEVGPAR